MEPNLYTTAYSFSKETAVSFQSEIWSFQARQTQG